MAGLLNEILAEQRMQELLRDAREAHDRAEPRERLRARLRLAAPLRRFWPGASVRRVSRGDAEAAAATTTGCSHDG